MLKIIFEHFYFWDSSLMTLFIFIMAADCHMNQKKKF